MKIVISGFSTYTNDIIIPRHLQPRPLEAVTQTIHDIIQDTSSLSGLTCNSLIYKEFKIIVTNNIFYIINMLDYVARPSLTGR